MQILKARGAEIMFRNRRLPYGEVDIVALKDEIIYIIEVKTVAQADHVVGRIGYRQKRVLRYNRMWIEEEFKLPTKILWAFVLGQKVFWVRDEGEV